MKKKILIGIRIIILLLLIAAFVLHPRINGALLVIAAIVFLCVIIDRMKPQNYDNFSDTKECIKNLLSEIIVFGAVWFFGSFVNIFCPYHAIYEYKGEMADLKENSSRYYDHFPDEIPKGAKRRKWYLMPSILQGNGCEFLYFRADEEYLKSELDRLSKMGTVYNYVPEQEGWKKPMKFDSKEEEDEYNNFTPTLTFRCQNMLPLNDNDTAVLILFVDNGDWNHPQKSLAVIDPVEGFAAYFCE